MRVQVSVNESLKDYSDLELHSRSCIRQQFIILVLYSGIIQIYVFWQKYQ